MSRIYIGLMSGTSVDGIDAVAVEITKNKLNIIATHHHEFPDDMKKGIDQLCSSGIDEIDLMSTMDSRLGQLYAETVNQLLSESSINQSQVMAIGSHGQTIRHKPEASTPYTLQIGDPNQIAQLTGITTVADFRRRDLAAHGQGAPLVPLFHKELFQSDSADKVAVNIGGIANITVIPGSPLDTVTGFDTGPGNRLMDLWIDKNKQQPFDENGNWAKSGSVNKSLLNNFLSDSYFSRLPPKSTGRELFNEAWLNSHLEKIEVSAQDVQATLVELTACSIVDAIKYSSKNCQEIIICGGGAFNDFLVSRIQHHAKSINITTSKQYGVDPQWVEAAAFAWLAHRTLTGDYGNLPTVTGAKEKVVLGGIYPGHNWPG
jgi:anhydro-N-acetylmuramic acid kinase